MEAHLGGASAGYASIGSGTDGLRPVANARDFQSPWSRAEDNRLRNLTEKKKTGDLTPSEAVELGDLDRRGKRFLQAGLREMEELLKDKPSQQQHEAQIGLVSRKLCWDMLATTCSRSAVSAGPGASSPNIVINPLAALLALASVAQDVSDSSASAPDLLQELKARIGALRLGGLRAVAGITKTLSKTLSESEALLTAFEEVTLTNTALLAAAYADGAPADAQSHHAAFRTASFLEGTTDVSAEESQGPSPASERQAMLATVTKLFDSVERAALGPQRPAPQRVRDLHVQKERAEAADEALRVLATTCPTGVPCRLGAYCASVSLRWVPVFPPELTTKGYFDPAPCTARSEAPVGKLEAKLRSLSAPSWGKRGAKLLLTDSSEALDPPADGKATPVYYMRSRGAFLYTEREGLCKVVCLGLEGGAELVLLVPTPSNNPEGGGDAKQPSPFASADGSQRSDFSEEKGSGGGGGGAPLKRTASSEHSISQNSRTNDVMDLIYRLSAGAWEALMSEVRSREGDVHLPKFTLKAMGGLRDTLQNCGCPSMFGGKQADAASAPVFADVVQLSECRVSERGLCRELFPETSAGDDATVGDDQRLAFAMPGSGGAGKRFELKCDRPFLAVVRHPASNSILLASVVAQPSTVAEIDQLRNAALSQKAEQASKQINNIFSLAEPTSDAPAPATVDPQPGGGGGAAAASHLDDLFSFDGPSSSTQAKKPAEGAPRAPPAIHDVFGLPAVSAAAEPKPCGLDALFDAPAAAAAPVAQPAEPAALAFDDFLSTKALPKQVARRKSRNSVTAAEASAQQQQQQQECGGGSGGVEWNADTTEERKESGGGAGFVPSPSFAFASGGGGGGSGGPTPETPEPCPAPAYRVQSEGTRCAGSDDEEAVDLAERRRTLEAIQAPAFAFVGGSPSVPATEAKPELAAAAAVEEAHQNEESRVVDDEDEEVGGSFAMGSAEAAELLRRRSSGRLLSLSSAPVPAPVPVPAPAPALVPVPQATVVEAVSELQSPSLDSPPAVTGKKKVMASRKKGAKAAASPQGGDQASPPPPQPPQQQQQQQPAAVLPAAPATQAPTVSAAFAFVGTAADTPVGTAGLPAQPPPSSVEKAVPEVVADTSAFSFVRRAAPEEPPQASSSPAGAAQPAPPASDLDAWLAAPPAAAPPPAQTSDKQPPAAAGGARTNAASPLASKVLDVFDEPPIAVDSILQQQAEVQRQIAALETQMRYQQQGGFPAVDTTRATAPAAPADGGADLEALSDLWTTAHPA